MSLRQVLDVVPYRLRNRFASMSSYVEANIQQALDEPRRRGGPGRRSWLSNEDRQTIQMVVFVVALGRFFQDGTRAASLATDAFASLGTAGFSVGRTAFEGRNANVMRGQVLREGLGRAIDNDEIDGWVNSNRPLGEIVELLVARATNA